MAAWGHMADCSFQTTKQMHLKLPIRAEGCPNQRRDGDPSFPGPGSRSASRGSVTVRLQCRPRVEGSPLSRAQHTSLWTIGGLVRRAADPITGSGPASSSRCHAHHVGSACKGLDRPSCPETSRSLAHPQSQGSELWGTAELGWQPEGRQPQGSAPTQAQLTEVLEHMEDSTLPEQGQLEDGVVLIVRVQHVDRPLAFRSQWQG